VNDGRGFATVNPEFQIVMHEIACPNLETISGMAGLGTNDDVEVNIRHDRQIRKEDAQALLDSRLWRSRYGRMPDDWGRMTRSLRPSTIRQPISSDILGEYFPERHRIVIHDKTCFLVMYALATKEASLCVPVPSGMKLALAHLISHAVSHLGVDRQGRIWDGYEDSSLDQRELFAQGYSYHFFDSQGSGLESMLFQSLSEHLSAEYNEWREYSNDLRGLNTRLMKARTVCEQ
jgi:hypothetical protein